MPSEVHLDGAAVGRRYLGLQGLRWLPTGLIIPVFVLLLQERGLTLTQIALAGSAQGLLVLLLELPTGGLADSIGRRPTLLLASAVDVASLSLLAVVADLRTAVLAFTLQGIYRALESGPLDAWFVDATLAADPDAEYERGLAHGAAVTSIAIAAGSLAASALVALAPGLGTNPLALPVVVAVGVRVVNLAAVAAFMVEVRPPAGVGRLRASVRAVPTVVRDAVRTVRASRVLLALVAVELFWGFGMSTFEVLIAPRLTEATGDPEQAAAILGPATTVAWALAALGAWAVPHATRRLGPERTAAAMRLLHGATVVAMGLVGGLPGVLAAFLAGYLVHGASNPVHQGLLHRQVSGEHRATVLSVNSLVSLPAGAVGGIVLGILADGPGLATAMVVGGIVIALAAPLYLVGRPRAGRAPAVDLRP